MDSGRYQFIALQTQDGRMRVRYLNRHHLTAHD